MILGWIYLQDSSQGGIVDHPSFLGVIDEPWFGGGGEERSQGWVVFTANSFVKAIADGWWRASWRRLGCRNNLGTEASVRRASYVDEGGQNAGNIDSNRGFRPSEEQRKWWAALGNHGELAGFPETCRGYQWVGKNRKSF